MRGDSSPCPEKPFDNDLMLLKEKLRGKKLILASRSPRRRELLAGTELPFVVADDYDIQEIYPGGLPAGQVAEYLAVLKSEGYPQPLATDEILVTADTVVISEGRILGKPRDGAQAAEMLRTLSGRRHTVITGVAIRDCIGMEKFSVATDVWFRPLREDEIEHYVTVYRPLDKAGAYGIQEWIGYTAIEKIEGSFYNVMGLPVQTLYVQLEKFLDR